MGTVGSAVAAVLHENAADIASRTGITLRVKKGCDIRKVKASCPVTKDPLDIIDDPEISLVVETIGGIIPAKKLVLAALRAGKHVVTSNKELLALHMQELQTVAEINRVALLFEGAVGGGIPILNTLRDNLSANRLDEVYGIVNGTTNFILSKMTQDGIEFSAALKMAKEKGYAEADPKADIEGYDASYKAAILASVAFGCRVKWEEVYREGIEKITAEDILYAGEIGYVIKLLAVAKRVEGELEVRVHPALILKSHPLAHVSENLNAIYVKGFPVGELMFYGPGAGGDPTASAIISDIINITRTPLRTPNSKLNNYKIKKIDETESRYYIRLQAPDKCGVLAGIARAFADKQVSIDAVNQKENRDKLATIVILVHKVSEKNLQAALASISQLAVVHKVCNIIRIL